MGGVRQAVLEFDAEVRVPWRPPLAGTAVQGPGASSPGAGRTAAGRPGPPVASAVLPGSGPRVTGHLRPVRDRPAAPVARGGRPAAAVPGTRRDPARPGARPVSPDPVRTGGPRARREPPRESSGVRLTRRGRRLVVVLVLAAGLGGAVLGREVLAPDGGLRLAGDSSVVVGPGDTVWSIAGEVAGPDQDVRVVVDAIEELNDLEGSVVVPGQVLRLP